MRAVCGESTAKLTHVLEQLDSILVQLECMLERESNPLRAYIDEVGSTVRLPWPIGQRDIELPSQIVCIDQDSEMRRPKLHRVQHPHARVVLCAGVHAFDPSLGVGWREILSWYLVEWIGLMEMVIVWSKAMELMR